MLNDAIHDGMYFAGWQSFSIRHAGYVLIFTAAIVNKCKNILCCFLMPSSPFHLIKISLYTYYIYYSHGHVLHILICMLQPQVSKSVIEA